MLLSQQRLQRRLACNNYRIVLVLLQVPQHRLRYSKSISKVPDGPSLKKGDKSNSFANFFMVPFFMSPALLFPGTRTKLKNVWILKIVLRVTCNSPATTVSVPRKNLPSTLEFCISNNNLETICCLSSPVSILFVFFCGTGVNGGLGSGGSIVASNHRNA